MCPPEQAHKDAYVARAAMWNPSINDVLHDLEYQATLPPGIDHERPGRLSLLYRRKDQSVGREVVMLKHRKR